MTKTLNVLTIDSFKGGRTNFLDQTTIDPSMCASGSMNVWAPQNILTKSPGLTLAASFTASGSSSINGLWCDDNVSTANKVYYNIFVSATGHTTTGQSFLFASPYVLTDSLTPLGYTIGTVAVGGISATGSGTLWGTASGSAGIQNGDRFQSSQNKNGWYAVSSVEDDTHLTLAAAVPTAVVGGTSYIVQPSVCGTNSSIDIPETSLNGNLIFSVFGQYMVRYDSTNMFRMIASSTASTVPPSPNFLTVFKGYAFGGCINYVGGSSFPSRLVWSALNDPTTWPSNNFIDIDLLHNGNISGLIAFGQELIIFKNRGMYKLVGNVFDPSNPTYFVQQITTPSDFIFNSNSSCALHTMSNASATYGGGGINYANSILIFYACGFMYSYSQGTTFISRISDSITLDMPNSSVGLGSSTTMGNYPDQQLCGMSYNGYYLLLGIISPNYTDPSNAAMLILDRNMKWWIAHNTNNSGGSGTWTGDVFSVSGTNRFALIPSTTAKSQLALSSPIGDGFGRIYLVNMIGPTYTKTYPLPESTNGVISYSDAAINGKWISKEFNIDFGTFWKIIIYMQKQPAGNLTVQWSVDQGSNTSQTIDMTSGRGTVIRKVIDINQKGSTIQLTLSNNVASQTFGVYAIKIYFTPSEQERIA